MAWHSNNYSSSDSDVGSVFNPAIAFLNRVNGLFSMSDECALTHDLETWLSLLKTIRRELAGDTNDDEDKTLKDKQQIIYPLRTRYLFYVNNKINVPGKIGADLFRELEEFEIMLRKLYSKYYPIPRKNDDSGL